jgi:hypothetical protein
MAFNKNKIDEICKIIDSLGSQYIGQRIPSETLSLVENLTIGDLIIEFNCDVENARRIINNITIVKRKNARTGLSYNKLEESVAKKVRKIVEECECEDDYHPLQNEHGGQTFEDHGAGEQVGMIKSNLYSIASKAQSLHDKIGDTDELPEWVQEKIAVADNMIDTISDYLGYEYSRKSNENEIA